MHGHLQVHACIGGASTRIHPVMSRKGAWTRDKDRGLACWLPPPATVPTDAAAHEVVRCTQVAHDVVAWWASLAATQPHPDPIDVDQNAPRWTGVAGRRRISELVEELQYPETIRIEDFRPLHALAAGEATGVVAPADWGPLKERVMASRPRFYLSSMPGQAPPVAFGIGPRLPKRVVQLLRDTGLHGAVSKFPHPVQSSLT